MKKLLALLLMLALVLTMFVACDKKDNDDDEKDGDEKTSETEGDKKPAKKDTEETPLKLVIDMMNSKTAEEMYEGYYNMLNGFAKKEVDALLKKAEKANPEFMEDILQNMEYSLEAREDEYGSSYKASYKLNEKTELEEEDLESYKSNLENIAETFESMAADAPEEYKDVADAAQDLADALKNAKVTKGYTLSLTLTQNDESEEETLDVYLVDGIWIAEASTSYLYLLLN